VAWWEDIRQLSAGSYVNKDNADCVTDKVTLAHLPHCTRDLEQMGDYLLTRYDEMIRAAGMKGKAFCGELPFHWNTDFDFSVFGGWKLNHDGRTYERDLMMVIPGRNRGEAVILADHYDTAYMEDAYEKERGGDGARLSAAGADDNYSATSTLLQAAPIFLQMAKEGKLERDVWLVNLTGEEFPSDCMGARHLAQALIQGTLQMRLKGGETRDLSRVQVVGAYVLDMIGHNRENDLDDFQISPGRGRGSLELARQAHIANLLWNVGAKKWNKRSERRGKGRGKRISGKVTIPEVAEHLRLQGEVRLPEDPRSSLFNTDGQVFSDSGIPVVLFMENYDINRSGYHDRLDTLENIDLDYGAAVAAIAIEAVARVATRV
jgi:Zn-dependent M28 family amino/carboxypeptidase